MSDSIRPLGCLCLALVTAFNAGCGGVGTVKGQVTVSGKPLPMGTIAFFAQDANNEIRIAPIADGNYTVADVPTGRSIIVVKTPDPALLPAAPLPGKKESSDTSPTMKAVAAAPPKGYVFVNKRYAEPGSSGLDLAVKRGEQTHNLALDP